MMPFKKAMPLGVGALVALTDYAFKKAVLKWGSEFENVLLLFLWSPVEEFAASHRADLRPYLLQERPVVVVYVLLQLVEFSEKIGRWGHVVPNEG